MATFYLYGTVTEKGKEAFVAAVSGEAPSSYWVAAGSDSATGIPAESTSSMDNIVLRLEATATQVYDDKLNLQTDAYTIPASLNGTNWCQIGVFDSETGGNLLYVGYAGNQVTYAPAVRQFSTGDIFDFNMVFIVGQG